MKMKGGWKEMNHKETNCQDIFKAKCLEGLVTFRFQKGKDQYFINSARRIRVEFPESAINLAQRILDGSAHPLGVRGIWRGVDLLLAKGKVDRNARA